MNLAPPSQTHEEIKFNLGTLWSVKVNMATRQGGHAKWTVTGDPQQPCLTFASDGDIISVIWDSEQICLLGRHYLHLPGLVTVQMSFTRQTVWDQRDQCLLTKHSGMKRPTRMNFRQPQLALK